jgi:hypothetical protein
MGLLSGGEMMKKTAFLMTLIVAVLLPFSVLAAQVGTFTAVNGRVDIAGADKVARLVKVGDPVDEGDVVRTKSNSRAEITFTDDNILRMAERSRVVISEYVSSNESLTARLTLSRGKVQNIVRKTGRIFGRLKKNRFEVHTPTAVVGVRGTNFFTYFQHGISGAVFKEGEGYGYNPNIPDQVLYVTAGQALLVVSDDSVPEVREADDLQIEGHEGDTAPLTEEEEEEKKQPKEEEPPLVTDPQTPSAPPVTQPPVEPEPPVIVIPQQPPTEKTFTVSLLESPAEYTNLGLTGVAHFILTSSSDTPVTYVYKFNDVGGTDWSPATADPGVDYGAVLLPDGTYAPPLDDGIYYFEYKAIADDGTETPVQIFSWTVDTSAPEVVLSNTPALDTNVNTANIGVTSLNETRAVTYTYELDGNAVGSSNLAGLSEGTHTFGVLATDDAGNTGTATFSWTTDYTAPTITLSNTPAAATNSNSADFGVSIDDETATYTYLLDGSQVASPLLTDLAEGLHAFAVEATDPAGNTTTELFSWTTDYTAPTISITPTSAMPEVTLTTDAAFTLVSDEEVSYSYTLDNGSRVDTLDNILITALQAGSHTLEVEAVDPAGNSTSSSLDFDLSRYSLSGVAAGAGSVISGAAAGDIAAVAGQSWGGWSIDMSGTFTGTHSPGWSVAAGGELFDSEAAEKGYWLDIIDGASGSSQLEYITSTHQGLGAGSVNAVFSDPDWQLTDTGTGTLTETPLMYFSDLQSTLHSTEVGLITEAQYDYADGGTYYFQYFTDGSGGNSLLDDESGFSLQTEYFSDGTWFSLDNGTGEYLEGTWNPAIDDIFSILNQPPDRGVTFTETVLAQSTALKSIGGIQSYVGGTISLWSGSAVPLTVLGKISSNGTTDGAWLGMIVSRNVAAGNETTLETLPGSYLGFTGGTLLNSSLDWSFIGLYEDDSSNTGFLTVNPLDSTLYQDSDMMKFSGTVDRWEIFQGTNIAPADFVTSLSINYGSLIGGGNFTTAGSSIEIAEARGAEAVSSTGEMGIWQGVMGGTYSGVSSDDWSMYLVGPSDQAATAFSDPSQTQLSGINGALVVQGSKWSDQLLSGRSAGSWVDLNEVLTGVAGGTFEGTFDPVHSTWQAVTMGAKLETGVFFDMVNSSTGRTTLNELNIPAVEIGSATLTGSNAVVNVSMNNVTFFSYATGEAPRIWAVDTDGVAGTYSAAPLNSVVNLSGNGLSAQFEVLSWQNNNWGAAVNGSGQLNGTVDVQFNGAAAGRYSGDISGSFTGSASGVSVPALP